VETPAPFRWTSQPSRRPPLSRDVWASAWSELVCISMPALCAGRERNGAGDLRRTSEPGRGDAGAVSLDVAAVQTSACRGTSPVFFFLFKICCAISGKRFATELVAYAVNTAAEASDEARMWEYSHVVTVKCSLNSPFGSPDAGRWT